MFIYHNFNLPLALFQASHLAFSLLNGLNPPGLPVLTSPTDPYLNHLYNANLLSLFVSPPSLNQAVTSSAALSKFFIQNSFMKNLINKIKHSFQK